MNNPVGPMQLTFVGLSVLDQQMGPITEVIVEYVSCP